RPVRGSPRLSQEPEQDRDQQHGGQGEPEKHDIPQRQRSGDAETGGDQTGGPEEDREQRRQRTDQTARLGGRKAGGRFDSKAARKRGGLAGHDGLQQSVASPRMA